MSQLEITFINGLIVKVNNMIFDYFFLKFYKGILKSYAISTKGMGLKLNF